MALDSMAALMKTSINKAKGKMIEAEVEVAPSTQAEKGEAEGAVVAVDVEESRNSREKVNAKFGHLTLERPRACKQTMKIKS